ncbi:hypothetical protein [Niastella populi]|uniref:Uncharacterized protein n=1 Tax=Niastella populi TaxID=550983 RepID=A0A1V9F341_9BACT|nr:hypothetical protein [Niastella populi]OQP52692.1 hypothetical protein A4R26_28480 [Niastella populi]
MEKRKLGKSKTTGKAASANKAKAELSVIVYVRSAKYVPDWIAVRERITDNIFTADISEAELAKLEADEQITSISINQRLNSLE